MLGQAEVADDLGRFLGHGGFRAELGVLEPEGGPVDPVIGVDLEGDRQVRARGQLGGQLEERLRGCL